MSGNYHRRIDPNGQAEVHFVPLRLRYSACCAALMAASDVTPAMNISTPNW
jgi:hypothetical protein